MQFVGKHLRVVEVAADLYEYVDALTISRTGKAATVAALQEKIAVEERKLAELKEALRQLTPVPMPARVRSEPPPSKKKAAIRSSR